MSIHWGGRGAGHISRWSIAPTGAPALDLNFLSGTLDSGITFSRASPATVINASGAIETSPINTARFAVDPVTLTQRGLLIEEPRTNLLTTSLINGVPLVTQSVSVTAVPHTLSFYGTGTVTLSGASVATVTGTGVYPNRRTITFTPILGVLVCTVVGIVQFAQLEVGAFATSFIPTAGAPVARSADIAVMTGTNFSRWFNASEGTLVASFETSPNLFATYVSASNGVVAQNSIHLDNDSGGTMRSVFYSGSAAQATLSLGAFGTAGALNTVASAYAVNDFAASRNGGAVVTDTSGALPLSLDRLNIGADPSGAAVNVTNSCIRSIRYYKKRLSNLQLQTLSR